MEERQVVDDLRGEAAGDARKADTTRCTEIVVRGRTVASFGLQVPSNAPERDDSRCFDSVIA